MRIILFLFNFLLPSDEMPAVFEPLNHSVFLVTVQQAAQQEIQL